MNRYVRLRFRSVWLLAWLGLFAVPAFAQTGPVGYWKLDEATGTAPQDSSGNANHCAMSPAPTWTAGKVNGALSFDGVDDAVNCGSGSTLGALSQMTVSAWVNLTSVGEGGIGRIAQKGTGGNPTAGWRLATKGTRQIEFAIDYSTGDLDRTSSTNAFSFSTWTHVAVTWSGTATATDVHLYVNGVEVSYPDSGDDGVGTRNSDAATALWIGNTSTSASTTDGKIDDVRVYNRVLSTTEIQALADSTVPTTPVFQTPTVTSSQVDLSWTASTDNIGVTGYLLERCQGAGCATFAQIAAPTGTSYSNTGLAASTVYRYQIRATDANTNLSAYSTIVTATTAAAGGDTQAPTTPTNLATTLVTSSQVDLSWTASTDNVGVTGYVVERCTGAACSNFASVGTPTGTTFSNTSLTASTTYRYRVRAGDLAGNPSGYSSVLDVVTQAPPDTSAPSTPANLSATALAGSSSAVNVAWDASTDNVAVTGYLLERCQGASCSNFAQIAAPSAVGYSDTGLAASTLYRYRVRATDAAPNLSGYSGIVDATTNAASGAGPVGYWKFDEATGTTPQDSSGNANHCTMSPAPTWTTGQFNGALTFDGVDDTVSCGSGSTLGTLSQITVAAWVNLASTGEGGLGRIAQKGTGGNPTAGWRFVTSGTRQLEFAIDYGTSDIDRVSSTNAFPLSTWAYVVATWDGSTAGTGVKLYVNGVEVSYPDAGDSGVGTRGNDTATVLRIGNTSTGASTTNGKIDEVRVYNRVLSGSEILALADSTVPSAPVLQTPTVTSTQVDLSWTASTDNIGVTGYLLERCQGASCSSFVQIAAPTGSAYSNGGLTASTAYRYRIRATDANSNLSLYSNIVTATTAVAGGGDTQAPTPPANLATTLVASSQVDLSWTASTDNVGVIGYVLERCSGSGCINFASIATPAGTTYSNTGLSALTIYRYQVRAQDAVPNLSAYSSILTVTTPAGADTQAPTTPGTPTATAASTSQLDLQWAASTDNVGVTAYLVERCLASSCTFSQIATVATNSYSDSGLTGGTSYQYRVRARDLANNLSGYSALLTQPTLTGGGTAGSTTYQYDSFGRLKQITVTPQ